MTVTSTAIGRYLSQWKYAETEEVEIYFLVDYVNGETTDTAVRINVIDFMDTLNLGDNVVISDLTAYLLANNAGIASINSIEASRLPSSTWDSNPSAKSAVSLRMFSMEQAVTSSDSVSFPEDVDIWIETVTSAPGFGSPAAEAAAEVLIIAYMDGLSRGNDIVHADLVTYINSITPFSVDSDDVLIGLSDPPLVGSDLAIESGETPTTDADKITWAGGG